LSVIADGFAGGFTVASFSVAVTGAVDVFFISFGAIVAVSSWWFLIVKSADQEIRRLPEKEILFVIPC
jgi:hypothetical protein